MLASDVVLTEPVQNIREFTVKTGEENVIFAVKVLHRLLITLNREKTGNNSCLQICSVEAEVWNCK